MSVQATSWVYKHGPRLADVDSSGRKYGTRARGMRSVLLVIADAANRDGEHAHPGVKAIVEESQYGRARALAVIASLVAEGWLEVTEAGVGRGRATVYRVCFERRETVQPVDVSESEKRPPLVDVSEPGKGPTNEEKGSTFAEEKVQSEGSAPYISTSPSTKTPRVAEATQAPDAARALAVLAFEQDRKPLTSFLNVRDRLAEALNAGIPYGELDSLVRAGGVTWTRAGLETALSKAQPSGQRTKSDAKVAAIRAVQAQWNEAS